MDQRNNNKKNIGSNSKINKNLTNKRTKTTTNFNTNLSVVMKAPDSNVQIEPKKEKEFTNLKINNPKKYLNIINDDCFHLEMNLKLLNFDKDFIKEKNSINNISATFNPFLK